MSQKSNKERSSRLTVLEKVLSVVGAAFVLATAVLTFITVQTNQAKNQAQSSAVTVGSSLSSLQNSYNQLKTQNNQLQTELNSAQAGPSTSAPSQVGTASGTVLGSYNFDIEFPYSVPLGPQRPTQAQFNTNGLGDLGTTNPQSRPNLIPVNNDRMVTLSGGNPPTYQACTASTDFVGSVESTPGNTLCVLGNNKVAGVTVASAQNNSVTVDVTVWSSPATTQ